MRTLHLLACPLVALMVPLCVVAHGASAQSSTIEFTTDEGTWMSLDVSPDGETLVFLRPAWA